eukprot:1183265-Prorocentrum_minimum.AAC.1
MVPNPNAMQQPQPQRFNQAMGGLGGAQHPGGAFGQPFRGFGQPHGMMHPGGYFDPMQYGFVGGGGMAGMGGMMAPHGLPGMPPVRGPTPPFTTQRDSRTRTQKLTDSMNEEPKGLARSA